MKINDLLNVLDDDVICNVIVHIDNPFGDNTGINSTLCKKKCSEIRDMKYNIANINVSHLTVYRMLNGEPAMLIVIDGVMQ